MGWSTTMSMMTKSVSGNSGATVSIAALVGEAGDDDRVVAALGEAAQRLLALGVGLQLELAVLDPGLLLEALGALERGLVERAVELAAEVEDDRRIGVLRVQRGRRRSTVAAAARVFANNIVRTSLDMSAGLPPVRLTGRRAGRAIGMGQ